jgi:hypothetical protein
LNQTIKKPVHKKVPVNKKEEKPIPKKGGGRKKEELADNISEDFTSEEEDVELPETAETQDLISSDNGTTEETPSQPAKVYPQRRDQAFNIEFDGVIMSEGCIGNDA